MSIENVSVFFSALFLFMNTLGRGNFANGGNSQFYPQLENNA
jgi:hypothetical protein